MNLREQVNRGKINAGTNNKKQPRYGSKPFMGLPSNRVKSTKKDSTPSSNINWGKSHQSISSSSGLHSETTSKEDSRIIVALSEGRGEARCEVGLAAINVSQPRLILCQISDTQSYHNTLRKINIFNPSQILVPMTFVESSIQSRFVEKVKDQFPDVNYTYVRRNTYNKASGMEYVQELCIPSMNSVLLVLQHKYYALTAASALLRFLQGNLNIFYASGSIRIDYQESEGYAIIDVSTADRLELVSSTKPLQATKYSTLFGVLNNCYTKIGERALRTVLLQPPYATSIILERQECVTSLMKRPEKLQAIQVMLQKMGNIDQLLTLSTIVIDDSQYWSNRQLNYMLYLNGLVDIVGTFNEVISDFEQSFFRNLCYTLNSEGFIYIRDKVRTLIHDNAHAAKSHNGLLQRCFAIKPGINGLLDLVRKVYSERLDDMRDYVKLLGEKYNLPLTLGNNISKGYHIVFSMNKHQRMSMKKSDIPKEFIQVCRLAGSFTMKTMELINFQSRIDDIVADIIKISNVMIFETLTSFKKYMGLFHKLCDDVAHVDVIQSLAEASIRNNYVKPTFADYTEVQESRHPMLDILTPDKIIPNLISSCEYYNIHIITGPNGSGKSIFIRQVILLQIMAQIGGYVPARSAVFKPADRLFARVYLEDNMECGASSFVLEMKEVIYILNNMTRSSLIVIDELARSTSLEEGAALAMAICERLAVSSAFVYLTSHFTLVTKLGEMYLNVKNWHMYTDAMGDTPRSLKLDFRYTLKNGVTNLERYGVFMVKNIWPSDILEDVYTILEQSTTPKPKASTLELSKETRLKYALKSDLHKLKSKGKLTLSKVNKLINQYRNELESLNVNFGNFDVNNVRWKQEEYQQMDYQGHFLDPEFIDPTSDEILSEAADRALDSLQEDYQNESFPVNSNLSYESSKYRQLSQFIDDDIENLNLLNPEINISYPEIEQDEPLEEEVNSINHSLLAAMKNEQEALKIKILSNVLINPKAQDCENYIQDLSGLNTANSQMNEYEDCSQYFKGFTQESVEVNPFNRSILEGMKVIQKNFIESNPQIYGEVPNNGLVTTSLNIMESYEDRNSNNENDSKGLFCIQQHSNQYQFWKENSNPGVLEDMQDFQFAKPIGKPYKAQISHKHYSLPEKTREETSLDDIDHLKFSLPLLQNQERTSTPKIDIFASQNSNVCDFSNFSDNIVSKEYINSFQNSHTIAKGYNESQKANKETFTHVFPKVKIIQGPDNLSQSFGEEDKKIRIRPNNLKKNKSHIDNDGDRDFERIDQKTVDKVIHLLPTMEMKENEPRRLPIKVNQKRDEDIIELLPVAKDMNEDENEFEKFIVEEVKSFLRDSTDIFEGDVDSLDITVEHNKNDEDVCKRIISHSFQQTRGEKLSLTKGNTGITKQRTVTTVQSSTSNEDSHLFVSLDNQNSIEVLTQNSKFDKLGKHEKLNEVPYMTAQRINLEYQSKLEEWTPGNVENKSNRCEENEELSNNFGENLNNKVMCVTEGRNNTSKLLNPINQIVEIKEKRREKIPLNKTLKNNMFEDDSHELDQFFDADLSISAMSVGSKISRTCKKHFTDTFRRDEKHCVNVNISTEAKEKSSKYGNNSNASDNKEPLVTTSISDASRRRNLDNSSSGSKSSDIKYYYNRQTLKTSTEDQSKSDDKNKVSTSISRASLLRNLENVSSDKSTTKDCMNIKDIGELPRCREIFDSSSTSIFETAEEMSVSNISKKRTFDESFSEKSDRENDVTKSQMQTNISENHDNQKFKAEIISKESALVRNVDKDKYTFQEPLEDDSKCTLDNEECAINNLETSISSSKYNRAIKALGYTKRDNRSLGSSKNVSQPKKRRSLFGSKKLTKHEIQEEFDKQDQILFEGNVDVETYSRYLKQRMNRPSVKQLQQAEHIATIKRTENGTLVLPAKKNKCKPKKYDKKSIFESVKFIDVSIFSDENASRMSAFLASDEKNYNLFKFNSENLTSSSQLSVFSNHFVQKRKNIKFKRSKTFGGLKVNDFTRINQNESSNSFLFKQSQQSQGSSFFIPSGYFKRHKSDIENICSKYLCPNDSLW